MVSLVECDYFQTYWFGAILSKVWQIHTLCKQGLTEGSFGSFKVELGYLKFNGNSVALFSAVNAGRYISVLVHFQKDQHL